MHNCITSVTIELTLLYYQSYQRCFRSPLAKHGLSNIFNGAICPFESKQLREFKLFPLSSRAAQSVLGMWTLKTPWLRPVIKWSQFDGDRYSTMKPDRSFIFPLISLDETIFCRWQSSQKLETSSTSAWWSQSFQLNLFEISPLKRDGIFCKAWYRRMTHMG